MVIIITIVIAISITESDVKLSKVGSHLPALELCSGDPEISQKKIQYGLQLVFNEVVKVFMGYQEISQVTSQNLMTLQSLRV